ncbi:cupin domain-containing protein [Paenibacillus sp. CAA11]|uniref:cupin domain-containing protein n=1 Tax=Paenibacillus sp. CAA11 TaxID=1532905 RepID=UPI000D385994|nr:cupin domain-containing protein [Paenibacillus sp. CAA11]AWB43893.1 cupin domain-containing protein [Paenibacillus sp. CAA11]
MYPNSGYHLHWHNPIACHGNNEWSHGWHPHDYNWTNYNNSPSGTIPLQDYGTRPLVLNIEQAAKQNNTYRTALWTGKYFQVTLMSINVGEDIGLEVHPTTDQFIRIEEGQGLVQMGERRDKLDFQVMAYDGYAIMIPAGKWHNVTNTGNRPLKLYVIYAPPHHPYGTVQETKAIAQGSR